MRVALIGPELEENLALRYIHAAVTGAGHEARIFDFCGPGDVDAVAAAVSAYGAEVAGLSMVFTSRAREFTALATRLRQEGFAGHVTAGGPFASFNAETLLDDEPAFDSVVHGDGEPGMVDLLARLDRPAAVRGLTWRAEDGRVVTNAPRPNADELDSFPRPTRPEVFPAYLGLPIANMLSSRGCTANCSFCSINAWHRKNAGARFRAHGVERVAGEIAKLYHERGVRIFNFHDDNFLAASAERNRRRVAELGRRLREARVGRIALQVKARPDAVEPQVLKSLLEIGLFRVFLGVESNAVAGLKTLGRGITREQNHRALELLAGHDIHASFNLLMFDPEATLADLGDNVAFLRRQSAFPLNFCRVEVYAGTAIEQRLRAEGRLRGDYRGWTYRLTDAAAQRAYIVFRRVFAERNFAIGGLNHEAMKLDYLFHLLGHFHPRRSSRDLRRRVKGAIAELNRHSAAVLDRVLAFAASREADDEARLAETAGTLRSEVEDFDREMKGRMGDIRRAIELEAARDLPVRTLGRVAAATVLAVAVSGCGDGAVETQTTEMAHGPVEPVEPPDGAPAAFSYDEAMRIETEINHVYRAQIQNLRVEHDLIDVTVKLELNAEGEVTKQTVQRVRRSEEGAPPDEGLAEDLSKLLAGVKIPDFQLVFKRAGSCTVTLDARSDYHMCEMAPADVGDD